MNCRKRSLRSFLYSYAMVSVKPLATSALSMPSGSQRKRIIFIRHGRTHMNDYIGGVNYGKANFTDIFPETEEYRIKYQDSPLTQKGVEQAMKLNSVLIALQEGEKSAIELLGLSDRDVNFMNELELILVSPLTRALQTTQLGLLPSLENRDISIIATPLASERVYLISDLGKSQKELKETFPCVDFDTAFPMDDKVPWYFTPDEDMKKNYVEWRPHGEGQVYACLGEPQECFDLRMNNLYKLLRDREESTIALVCHAGVTQWFLDEIFENCEIRVVEFEDLKSKYLRGDDVEKQVQV